jgi:hypothetical protein
MTIRGVNNSQSEGLYFSGVIMGTSIKDFLSQAYRIDLRINSKLEQVRSLHDLATRVDSVMLGMPRSVSRNIHRLDNIIVKLIDLENEIQSDIDGLLRLKQEIAAAIASVENQTYQTLLELRYLCMKSWEYIASELGYERRYVLKMHDKALRQVKRH